MEYCKGTRDSKKLTQSNDGVKTYHFGNFEKKEKGVMYFKRKHDSFTHYVLA